MAGSALGFYSNWYCRARESEVQEWMETATQSDRGLEEAKARAAAARDAQRGLELEAARLRQFAAQLQHADRSKEAAIQKLKERLSEKVCYCGH